MIVDGDAAKRHNDNLDSVDAMLEDIGLSRYHGPHESPTQRRNPKVVVAPSEKRCLGVTLRTDQARLRIHRIPQGY